MGQPHQTTSGNFQALKKYDGQFGVRYRIDAQQSSKIQLCCAEGTGEKLQRSVALKNMSGRSDNCGGHQTIHAATHRRIKLAYRQLRR